MLWSHLLCHRYHLENVNLFFRFVPQISPKLCESGLDFKNFKWQLSYSEVVRSETPWGHLCLSSALQASFSMVVCVTVCVNDFITHSVNVVNIIQHSGQYIYFLFTDINYTGDGATGVHAECFSTLSAIFSPQIPFLTLLSCSSPTLVIETDQLMADVLK